MSVPYPAIEMSIDGRWTAGSGGATRDVIDPATGATIGNVPMASATDLDRALAGAARAFATWRRVAPIDRTAILMRAAQLIRERVETIAPLAVVEEGMPLAEARGYLLRGAELVEWDANEGRRLYGRIVPSDPSVRQMVVREPIGVVAAFSPWNGPAITPCRKIGSALAAGCALILKAAEETPATAMMLVKLFEEAGVPPGVISLVFGDPAQISEHLIASDVVRLVTFTGSVPVGKRLAALAAARMKPSVMELGGHAPVLICDDADVDAAAERVALAKWRNAGQACVAPTRLFAHASIYDRFLERLLAATARVVVGPGFAADTTMGPLANVRRLEAIDGLVADAVTLGAIVRSGGARIGNQGFFYPPTILSDVPAEARILHEEPFGPLLAVSRFTDLDAAVAQANALPYGLAGYVFTRSSARAAGLAAALECGSVAINHLTVSTHGIPFGGVKDSGYGREGGSEGVANYTIGKTITEYLG